MRILHVYRSYAPLTRGGGVERYIHQLGLASVAQGHSVCVVARTADAQGTVYPVVQAGWGALYREIRAADYVHIHGPRTVYAAFAGVMAWAARRPFIYTLHCFYRGKTWGQVCSKFLWDQFVERWLLWRARRVIVLSEHWRAYLAAHRLPRARAKILPNGIDVVALRAELPPPVTLVGNPVLLSVCRLDVVKRVEDMIWVLAQPGMEQAHLHLVGDGPDRLRLQQIAAAQGVEARVTFHGFQSDERIAAMARAAHLFVIASAEEGMPTTILEMLARGLPVVASRIPGNLSLTEPLGWDYTYPLGDVEAMAQQLQRAQNAAVSAALLARLEEQFDWSVIGRAMLDSYGEH